MKSVDIGSKNVYIFWALSVRFLLKLEQLGV